MKQNKKPVKRMIRKKSEDGITAQERVIAEAPLPALVNEYNLIKAKQSKLSAHLRECVKLRVNFLIEKGVIKIEDDNAAE